MAAQRESMASVKNPKVQLHDLLQKKGERPPEYEVLFRTGPDHRPTFNAQVTVEWEGRQLVESGEGSSKKVAEKEAAAKALKMMIQRKSARSPVPKPSSPMVPPFVGSRESRTPERISQDAGHLSREMSEQRQSRTPERIPEIAGHVSREMSEQLAQELRGDAEKCLKGDKDVMEAIKLFTQAIGYDPKSAVLYIRRAHAYIRAGYLVPASSRHFYKQALKDTEDVIALQPRWRAGYLYKGRVLIAMDRLEDAEKVLKEGLELAITKPLANEEDLKSQIRSEMAQIKRKEGITAFKAQDYQKALQLYTEAIELSFGSLQSHEFYAKRAEVYYELRESEEMLQDANECIARKFDWPWGYYHKARAYHQMGQPLEAMQAAQEGLQYTTPDQEASVQLMWLMRDASTPLDKLVKETSISDSSDKPTTEDHLQVISQPLTSMHMHGTSDKGVKADENSGRVCDLLKDQDICTEETGLQHKPTLSSLPYEEYVSEFGRLFTDGFDVQDEIAEAVFDSCSEDIVGVALGAKSVTLPEPDPVDGDNRQVRPCMVVMVTSENNEVDFRPQIVENVLKAIQQKHKNTDRYVPEPNTELPHWMKFLLYKLEYEESELLMVDSEDCSPMNHADGVHPGSLICTDDGCVGTLGMFIAIIIKQDGKEVGRYHHGLTCQHVLFHPDREHYHKSITQAIQSSRLDERGQFKLKREEMTYNHDDCMLALATFPTHFDQDNFSTVYTRKPGNEAECQLELGKYEYGVWASCQDSREEMLTPPPIQCCDRLRYKPDMVDLGSFSASATKQLHCSLGGAQLLSDVENWVLFAGIKYTDLFKHRLQPAQDGTLEVFTCNIRNDGKLPEKCERRAIWSIGSRRKFNPRHSLLARSIAVGNPQAANLPYIQLKEDRMSNKRNFANRGDSGSLLYMKVKPQHEPGQSTQKVTAIVVGMLSSHTQLDDYAIIHGFYLQPALDILASELFFIDANHFADSSEQQKAVITEYYRRKDEPQGDKCLLVARKKWKLQDLEFTYEPCLNGCATHSESVHSGRKYVLSIPSISTYPITDGIASNGKD